MTAPTLTLTLNTRVNWRRVEHIRKHAIATLRRARRGDRPAILHRFAAQMARECVRVEVQP